MTERGAEEINKKQKIIILLNETKYNFRKQQKFVGPTTEYFVWLLFSIFVSKYKHYIIDT